MVGIKNIKPVVGIHSHFLDQCFANVVYALTSAEETSGAFIIKEDFHTH